MEEWRKKSEHLEMFRIISAMNKTPLDTTILALLDDFYSPSDLKRLLLAFAETLQVKYLHMHDISKVYWRDHQNMMSPNKIKTIGDMNEEIMTLNQETVQARINYFGFIEELNRFGRIFDEEFEALIPNYYRIRFFRNKMVEHWTDYSQFILQSKPAIKIEINKLVVPYHLGYWGGSITEIPNLRKEFKRQSVALGQLNGSPTYPGDCENIYKALECIDSKLKSSPPNKKTAKKETDKKEISEDLVKAIFRFGFPNPIHDLENYIKDLILWIEVIKLTNPPRKQKK